MWYQSLLHYNLATKSRDEYETDNRFTQVRVFM